jgi:hypothetical protein
MLSEEDRLAMAKMFYEYFDEVIKTLTQAPTSAPEILSQSAAADKLRDWARDMRKKGPGQVDIVCARSLGIQLAQKAILEGNKKVGRWTALGRLLAGWAGDTPYVGFSDDLQIGYRKGIEEGLRGPDDGDQAKAQEVSSEYESKFPVLKMTDETAASIEGTKSLADTESLASITTGQTLRAADFFSLILPRGLLSPPP